MPPCHVLHRWDIVLHKHKVPTEDLSRPRQHVIPHNLNVAMPAHHPIQDDHFAPPAMMDCIPDHDRWAAISMCWLKQASISPSHCPQRTRALPSLWHRENLDSSLKMQCLQWRRCQIRCLRPHSPRRRLCTKVSLGHLAGHQNRHPATRSRFITVRAIMYLPKRRIICILRREAEIKRFILIIRSKWRPSWGVYIFCLPPRFLWSGRLCCLIPPRTFPTHPFVTPIILATSHWELTCIDNKTICHKTCSSKFRSKVPPITRENRKKIVFKTQVLLPKWQHLDSISSRGLRHSTLRQETLITTKSVTCR